MAIRRLFVGLAVGSIFVIGMWLPGSILPAVAETLNYKFFTHVTKGETFSIADAEGHFVGFLALAGRF